MEKLAEVELNEEQRIDESFDSNISSSTSSPKQIANPVVYKLVRVEGDGRLVPATDDEVMEVENMFEEKKVEARSIADTGQVEVHISDEESPSVEAKTEDSEGKSQGEDTKVDAEKLNARLEYIGVMLQQVKQEENLRLSKVPPKHSSTHKTVDGQCSDQRENLSAVKEKLPTNHSLQETSLLTPILDDSSKKQLVSGGTCVKSTEDLAVSGSSASASCSSSMPDFSRIKGEICLDNQTVRELQETFRATFGRETTVKDKLWLKRRIAMGLTNSCDISTTTFIIKDNVLVRTIAKDTHSTMESCKYTSQFNEVVYNSCKDLATIPTVQIENQQVLSYKRLRKPEADNECKSEDVCTEQSGSKRVRKPTRRYIEELSESDTKECAGRCESSAKHSVHGQSSPKSRISPVCVFGTDETALIPRYDSFGGSGVQVPHVSRMRRGRPRENFMSIMQCHPSGMGMAVGVEKNVLGVHISEQDSETGDRNCKDRATLKHNQEQVVSKTEPEKENVAKCIDEPETVYFDNIDSGDNSECNLTSPTSKYSVRRKHHRAWTLSEVIKLVEGVAKYGAGRWSEIKKVAFASYTYRTSVDLKDKWRNLLRASFAQGSNDKGMRNSRKHGSMPLPAPILLRVRQLAEKHSGGTPVLSSSKFTGCSGRSVLETRSGYL
ncbi:Trf-like [Thalictrum thalictroides]|uniref:Trf-like n=1 Tax=Thalictrum thalictroides TaxID=46969 RepID=A0A7J6VTM6_THATH|nr:Trf-like [Thalictrum thalictroides]